MTPTGASHRPRRRFGQNFLTDDLVIERIANAIAPGPTDSIVELGPGLGALTGALLERIRTLDVIEIDRDLAASLPARLDDPDGLNIHQRDALRFDFADLAARRGPLRVVGNLPYNISSPLLFHLLAQRAALVDMHFMLQLEVVERLTAHPGTRAYGRLGIMVGLLCRTEMLFTVEPESFSPAPKVRSAVVRLEVRDKPAVEVADSRMFEEIVRRAFTQRRKTLRNALKGLLAPGQWEAAGVDPGARAETLHLVDFARLSNELSRSPRPG